MTRLVVTPHILRATLRGDTTRLVDTRLDRAYRLSPEAGVVFRSIDSTGRIPDTPGAGQIADVLRQRRFLAPESGATRRRAEAPSAPVAVEPAPWQTSARMVTATDRLRAAFAVIVCLAVLFTSRAWLAHVLKLTAAASRRCAAPATPIEIQTAILAVRQVTAFYPGRFACLETSLSVALALAVARRDTRLRIGVADDPTRRHAWVETTTGVPVIAPRDDAVTRVYTPYS